jgi:sec-independent protein translocase protein TatB
MFDLGWQEIFIIAVVTLIVVGPKDLPKLFKKAGNIVGNIKQVSREFFDKVNEAAEMEEISSLKSSISDIGNIDDFSEVDMADKSETKKLVTKEKKLVKTKKKLIKQKQKDI